jgi:hypothetical protein
MKTITPSLHGLASSLLFNLGLTKAAEKLDPSAMGQVGQAVSSDGPCFPTIPSAYSPRVRR